jgi:hypothetical protein
MPADCISEFDSTVHKKTNSRVIISIVLLLIEEVSMREIA